MNLGLASTFEEAAKEVNRTTPGIPVWGGLQWTIYGIALFHI